MIGPEDNCPFCDEYERRIAQLERELTARERDALERAAKVCEDMRPAGGRQWNKQQAACYSALSAAAKMIRALTPSTGGG